MALFQNANYNFIKWRWHALVFSAVVIIAGIAYGATRGVPLGIDFSGGTILVVKFPQPVTDDQVRDAIASVTEENVIQTYGDPAQNQKLIRIPQLVQEEGASVAAGQLVARVSELNNYRVEATLSDFHARLLAPGQQVRVEQNGETLAGTVHTVLPEIQNGAVKLLVDLADPNNKLLRNKMRVDVNIITERKAGRRVLADRAQHEARPAAIEEEPDAGEEQPGKPDQRMQTAEHGA